MVVGEHAAQCPRQRRVIRVHKGRWFELSGKVDSYWTRSVLFSLVPKKNGRRFIIDKLQVVTFPEGSAWI